MDFSITSVEQIPNLRCLAAFTPKTNEVFKEEEDTDKATAQVKQKVDDFLLDNDLTTYFFGVSQDFKHFGF